MTRASREIIRVFDRWPTFRFLSSPDQLGPGSSSLLALIEREFTPRSVISRVRSDVKKK